MTDTIYALDRRVYITSVPVTECFVDHSYQRELDKPRAQQMAKVWDPQLAGVLDVADRQTSPMHSRYDGTRYAIINGQHRWAAAGFLSPDMHLVVNVHTGLTVEQEAQLFFDIDAKTKALSTWDRWHSRRAAGDATVVEIERVVGECGCTVTQSPGEKNLQCCATLEKIFHRADTENIADTLTLLGDVWPGDRDAVKAVIVDGVALVLDYYCDDVDTGRLADRMSEITPKQLHARASELRERVGKGQFGSLIAQVLASMYNRSPGPKLMPFVQAVQLRKSGGL